MRYLPAKSPYALHSRPRVLEAPFPWPHRNRHSVQPQAAFVRKSKLAAMRRILHLAKSSTLAGLCRLVPEINRVPARRQL